jgi:transposase
LVGCTGKGKGTKIMALVDSHGLPVALTIHSASPVESTLVGQLLDAIPIRRKPERLIGDRIYCSFRLYTELQARHIDLIAPEKCNRVHRWQDLRKLRRYARRWKVERLFAWLNQFRRVPTRWERHAENYLGFLLLAAILIDLRYL